MDQHNQQALRTTAQIKSQKKTSTYNGVTYTTEYAYIGADRVRITESTVGSSTPSKIYVKDAYLNTDGSLKNWTETVATAQTPGTIIGTGILKNVTYDGEAILLKT